MKMYALYWPGLLGSSNTVFFFYSVHCWPVFKVCDHAHIFVLKAVNILLRRFVFLGRETQPDFLQKMLSSRLDCKPWSNRLSCVMLSTMHWSRKWRGLRLLRVRWQSQMMRIIQECSRSRTALPSSSYLTNTQFSTMQAFSSCHINSNNLIQVSLATRCYPTQIPSLIWCSKTRLGGSKGWTLAKDQWLWKMRQR